jgi:MFS family permease
MGAKNTIIFGFFLITLTTFGLGLIHYIKDHQVFYYTALALRFFQGQGDVLLQFTGYCIITNVYSDNVMQAITYIEIIVGLGLGLGPLIGSAIYPYLAYEGTMYAFGFLNLFTMTYSFCKIPNALNETASDAEVAELESKVAGDLEETPSTKKKIGWCTLLTNRHTFFSLLLMFIGTTDVMFFKVFFVLELDEKFGIDEENAGYFLASTSFVYLVGCLLLPYTCEHSPRKLLFALSMFGFGGCIFLLGPSLLLGFPADIPAPEDCVVTAEESCGPTAPRVNFWLMLSSLPIMGIF